MTACATAYKLCGCGFFAEGCDWLNGVTTDTNVRIANFSEDRYTYV